MPRRKVKATITGEATASPAVSPAPVSAETEVLVLHNCRLAGVRHEAGERILIPTERVTELFDGGLVVSRAQVDAIWAAAGRNLSPGQVPSRQDVAPYDPSALKVLQLTSYDPGCSVYRYHSAANAVPGVVSALVRFGHSNPHCDLRQWDGEVDARTVHVLLQTADVVHCHMDYRCLTQDLREGVKPGRMMARTYHGSVDPANPSGSIKPNEGGIDDKMGAVVFGARPYHHRYAIPHWLPIPMPVADYQALAKGVKRGKTFRIAHSPTRRSIKGTTEFLRACEYLKMQEGLDIEPVLIEHMGHGEALATKATCDATFDSFWLGIQGSGLEAGAMGKPVIAGDADAVRDLENLGIPCPYTFAADEYALRDAIRRLATDAGFYAAEAKRLHEYVCTFHDYPVVGAKYATILTEAHRGAADRR